MAFVPSLHLSERFSQDSHSAFQNVDHVPCVDNDHLLTEGATSFRSFTNQQRRDGSLGQVILLREVGSESVVADEVQVDHLAEEGLDLGHFFIFLRDGSQALLDRLSQGQDVLKRFGELLGQQLVRVEEQGQGQAQREVVEDLVVAPSSLPVRLRVLVLLVERVLVEGSLGEAALF